VADVGSPQVAARAWLAATVALTAAAFTVAVALAPATSAAPDRARPRPRLGAVHRLVSARGVHRLVLHAAALALTGASRGAHGTTAAEDWAIGQALLVGLQIQKRLAPALVTPEVFERAFVLLAGLFQEQ